MNAGSTPIISLTSVIEDNCSFGAGAVITNFHLDETNIRLKVGGEEVESGVTSWESSLLEAAEAGSMLTPCLVCGSVLTASLARRSV